MAVGQRQRLYSGVRMFTGNYLSSTPRALRIGGVQLELTTLIWYRYHLFEYLYLAAERVINISELSVFVSDDRTNPGPGSYSIIEHS